MKTVFELPKFEMNRNPHAASSLPDMACVILVGGQSRRFGSNKAFAALNGARLIDIAFQQLAAQSVGPIAINAQTMSDYDDLSAPVIADRLRDAAGGGLGPLAGLHAAMLWAADLGYETVITTPVDTPLLPDDFVARLTRHGAPAVACSNTRTHPTHGIWPTALHDGLAKAIKRGMRAARDWHTTCQAGSCDFPMAWGRDPFANINRPADLAALQDR